jgi:hypothetical protein
MNGKYFPRYNILLIDGKNIFTNAFGCFLEKIYELRLFDQKEDTITITSSKEIDELLLLCLEAYTTSSFKQARHYIKQNKLYCNIVIYFNLKYLDNNLEIFNYINFATISKITNKFIKSCKSKKINFYLDKIQSSISFADSSITVEESPTSKIKETLNIINFNLS